MVSQTRKNSTQNLSKMKSMIITFFEYRVVEHHEFVFEDTNSQYGMEYSLIVLVLTQTQFFVKTKKMFIDVKIKLLVILGSQN